MTHAYDPGHLHEGSVLLAGYVPGGGLTMFRDEDEALNWLLEPPDGKHSAPRARPNRKVVRFQVTHLAFLEAVLPPAPVLQEVPSAPARPAPR